MSRFGFRRASGLVPWMGLVLLLVLGCGQKEVLPKTYPAKGKVVLENGKSLPGGVITFTSVADPDRRAYAEIAADGTFTLESILMAKNASSESSGGAIEGEFYVNIRPNAGGGGDNEDGSVGPPVGGGRPAVTLKQTYKVEAKANNEITVTITNEDR